jgi:hypothetical protein
VSASDRAIAAFSSSLKSGLSSGSVIMSTMSCVIPSARPWVVWETVQYRHPFVMSVARTDSIRVFAESFPSSSAFRRVR